MLEKKNHMQEGLDVLATKSYLEYGLLSIRNYSHGLQTGGVYMFKSDGSMD